MTVQFEEELIYNGKRYNMTSLPLTSYPKEKNINGSLEDSFLLVGEVILEHGLSRTINFICYVLNLWEYPRK